ncbi:MAG: hypothetical protein CMH64_00530 [Nanoarchaeota archaeon]|nr:hypothetical protein [Nanoarchaeota archaeon]|tara:strand:- start:91 stop:1122 length:1032 start_codon:yes stop_codon:yes gene_type:complete
MIIGLTGFPASGKGTIIEVLKEKGFTYLSTSDELREIAKIKNIEVTRENLQTLGTQIKKENGYGFLAEVLTKKIQAQEYKTAVIDGIRHPKEIELFRNLKNFILIAVDASQELRFQRMKTRGREQDPTEWEEFLKMEEKEKGINNPESGLQVDITTKLADHTITNNSTIEELKEKTNELIENLERKTRPNWDEYFMEIAKTVAKRATCNRGRSGCVIAKDKRILVTGYVGSPIGIPHCDEVGHQMKTLIHEDGEKTQHCVRTTHAEQNAICQAANLGVSIKGATLYCKMTPCSTCAKLIINSGIKKVISEKKYHAGKESEELFEKAKVKYKAIEDEIELYKFQ